MSEKEVRETQAAPEENKGRTAMTRETMSGQNHSSPRAYWKYEERILSTVFPSGRQGTPWSTTANQ